MPKNPKPNPVDELLNVELPQNPDAYYAQARAMADRYEKLEAKMGQLDGDIDACKEEILKVKQKFRLTEKAQQRREVVNDMRRLARENLVRSGQLKLAFA